MIRRLLQRFRIALLDASRVVSGSWCRSTGCAIRSARFSSGYIGYALSCTTSLKRGSYLRLVSLVAAIKQQERTGLWKRWGKKMDVAGGQSAGTILGAGFPGRACRLPARIGLVGCCSFVIPPVSLTKKLEGGFRTIPGRTRGIDQGIEQGYSGIARELRHKTFMVYSLAHAHRRIRAYTLIPCVQSRDDSDRAVSVLSISLGRCRHEVQDTRVSRWRCSRLWSWYNVSRLTQTDSLGWGPGSKLSRCPFAYRTSMHQGRLVGDSRLVAVYLALPHRGSAFALPHRGSAFGRCAELVRTERRK